MFYATLAARSSAARPGAQEFDWRTASACVSATFPHISDTLAIDVAVGPVADEMLITRLPSRVALRSLICPRKNKLRKKWNGVPPRRDPPLTTSNDEPERRTGCEGDGRALTSIIDIEYLPMPRTELLKGTLDLLILRTLELEPRHGFSIAERLEQVTEGTFSVGPGSLFRAFTASKAKGSFAANGPPTIAAAASRRTR
jgi:hypothetical protein